MALFAQTVAFGAHAARDADDPRAVAASLSKILGARVVLCVQDEGAPADSGACHHACPLCQLAAHTAALTAPETPAVALPPPPVGADRPLVQADARPETEPIGLPFATGPPRSL